MRRARHTTGGRTRLTGIACLLVCSAGLAAVSFDGTVNTGGGEEWGSPKASALQDNYTGYGDQKLTPGGFGGSELDELYVRTDGTYLYVGVTGNLEQNGNAIILLFDTAAGGQNVLATEIAPVTAEMPCSANGPPSAVQGLGQALLRDPGADPESSADDTTFRDPGSTGTVLDAGFEPDHAIAVDTSGAIVSVTQYSLSAASLGTWDDPGTGLINCLAPNEALPYYATRVYRGQGTVNSGSGGLNGGTNPNGSLFAFNNTGKQGVTGESDTPPPAPGSGLPGDPRTQTTGLEAKIHLADLGYTTPVASPLTLKMSVLLTSSNGYVSNQTLPPIGGGTSLTSLGYRPDLTAVAGDQYATVVRTVGAYSQPVDGTAIVSNFGVANVVASQDTVTGFGDRDCLQATAGSELDELFLRTDGQYLYVGVTGNLEGNGNAQILLLDVRPGGQNVLASEIAPIVAELPCSGNGPPGAVQGLGQALQRADNGTPEDPTDDTTSRDPLSSGTRLDTGFAPDYAIAVDTAGGTVHVTQYDLYAASQGSWDDPGTGQPDCAAPNEALDYYATRVYRGQIALGAMSTGPSSLTGGTNPNGSEFAFNNTGTAGVSGSAVAAPGSGSPGDPRSQTRGLEARISLLDLGFSPGDLPVAELNVKAAVLLTSGEGFVSSQTLPGIGAGLSGANLGNRPDLTTAAAGNQYASASLTPAAFSPMLDGRNIVGEFGLASLQASQDTVTSFGDVTLEPVTDCDQEYSKGSELDQLIVQDIPGYLQIAVTGNLENNGNKLVIFLDTIPSAGESLLAANTGPVGGMNGDTVPLDADYAVIINIYGTNAYVDFANLIANTSSYMGFENLNQPDGLLEGGAGGNWIMFANNTNVVGVTGSSGDDPQTANAATAVTGFEIQIPLDELGPPTPEDGDDVCVWAILAGGNTAWLSNQILPAGLGGGRPNFDDRQAEHDFVLQGYSCMPVTLGPAGPDCSEPVRYDIDGDSDVDMDDFAVLQRCYTHLTSSAGGSIGSGCECFDWGLNINNRHVADDRIDESDLNSFLLCAGGPGVVPLAACDDNP